MPDQYGNPTEAEMRGQAPANPFATYTQTPEIKAAIAARNSSGVSTRDVFDQNGVTHDERAALPRDTSANALSFQSAFADDPYYQRDDIAPALQATNKDVLGGGKFGVRGWMNDHPLGVMAAFIAAAGGGAALAGLGGGAGAGSSALTAAAPPGAGAAATAAGGAATAGGGGLSLGGIGSFLGAHIGDIASLAPLLGGLKAPGGGGGPAPSQGSNPFGSLGGGPVSMPAAQELGPFSMSGFRDQNAFKYLMDTLGLPSPGGAAAPGATALPAPTGYAPPANLEAFSGMDFGSMFGNMIGAGKTFGLPGGSSPKTSPFQAFATAQNAGTRGPDVDPGRVQASLAGPLGNGGGALTTKRIPAKIARLSTKKR